MAEMNPSVHLAPINAETMSWKRRWGGTREYWIGQALGWGGFVLLSSLSFLAPNETPKEKALGGMLAIASFGVLTTHLLRIVILYYRHRNCSGWKLALSLAPWWLFGGIGLGGAISMISVCWVCVDQLAAGTLIRADGWEEHIEMVTHGLFFTAMWIGVYFGCQYYGQYRASIVERLQLESGMKEAELRALKAQLNPHFLFNALNSIRAMVPRELTAPRQAVTSLSEMLRGTLEFGHCERITLAQELSVVAHYLALEQMRHEARLGVEQVIEPAALTWVIPPFIVQTLVENAVNHGIAQLTEGGVVSIHAFVEAEHLIVEVTNPGQICANERSTGLGLRNARARLALLFGPEASVTLQQVAESRVRARLTVPSASGNSRLHS